MSKPGDIDGSQPEGQIWPNNDRPALKCVCVCLSVQCVSPGEQEEGLSYIFFLYLFHIGNVVY